MNLAEGNNIFTSVLKGFDELLVNADIFLGVRHYFSNCTEEGTMMVTINCNCILQCRIDKKIVTFNKNCMLPWRRGLP
eukprot:1440143-Ditylum_brightwellii.AAC.1